MNTKRIVGIALIATGILFCCGLMVFQYQHCVDMWSNTYKAQEYASALEYFFAVSKGAIAISILGGSVLVISGILLRKKQR